MRFRSGLIVGTLTIDANHAGYSGSGFCDGAKAAGASVGDNTVRISPTTGAGLLNIDYLDADTTGGPSAGPGRPDDPDIQFYGRWNTGDPAYLVTGWAGGYLEARFTGGTIGVRQRNAIDHRRT